MIKDKGKLFQGMVTLVFLITILWAAFDTSNAEQFRQTFGDKAAADQEDGRISLLVLALPVFFLTVNRFVEAFRDDKG
jgi:hypothetical protein